MDSEDFLYVLGGEKINSDGGDELEFSRECCCAQRVG